MKNKKTTPELNYSDFNKIKITLASPTQIRSWSHGEVKKPETINYRTFKPERDGLFCEKIFGPVRDFECNCGKYKWFKYKGVVCDRCGVEVTESKVRRERMGHIELATPIVHLWYFRKTPSKLSILLDIKLSDIEKIIYCAKYVVLSVDKNESKLPLHVKQTLTDEEYGAYKNEPGLKFKVGIGGSAILELIKQIDLEKEAKQLREEIKKEKSDANAAKLIRRLRLINGFIASGVKPEWMVLTVLPVLPPDLRPLVPLEGGRFAASDLNDLYRRIINRNNRLKHLESLKSPGLMIHNEKRLLQEAVDSLIENGSNGRAVTGAGNRPLKSLSDIIKGKNGRFRQNLLGKRVDYSGRSVIVVGPELRLDQCGLPKEMALELFKPYIIREIMKRGLASSLKSAKRFLEKQRVEVWDILESITKEHPVMLNRAPTLHRLGIQAFNPVLIEGKAIRLHPLTCSAFNADFDGDQMAVHVPLSEGALAEVKERIMATKNIVSPASGRPISIPTQDMVLGCCYLTKEKHGVPGEGMIFSDFDEVITAYQNNSIDLHARIKVKGITDILEKDVSAADMRRCDKWKSYTTVGRVLFNNFLPEKLRFINKTINKKDIAVLVERCFSELGEESVVPLLDNLKKTGFRYATLSGISISIDDMLIPPDKSQLISQARKEVREIEEQAHKGVITNAERYNNVIDIWTQTTDKVSDRMFEEMKNQDTMPYKKDAPKFNSLFMMADSGARGSRAQVRQLGGMRGLMAKPAKRLTGEVGEIIEQPVESNFREGLTVLEYFISTHGGRKGLADTALKTSEAGYLTRRLVDVAHDVVVTEEDCGTLNGIKVDAIVSGDGVIESLADRIVGRYALDNIVGIIITPEGEYKEELIVKAGELITRQQADQIAASGIERLRIRSVLTCESKTGVCAKCYGLNLATNKHVELGEPVGIIASQSIGEPGTQLTLRTFHIGGTASRIVREANITTDRDTSVKFYKLRTIKDRSEKIIVVSRNAEVILEFIEKDKKAKVSYKLPYGAEINFKGDKKVPKDTVIAEWDLYTLPIVSEHEGKAVWKDVIEGETMREIENKITQQIEHVIIEHRTEKKNPRVEISEPGSNKKVTAYPLPIGTNIVVHDGQPVHIGDVIAKIPRSVSKIKDITGGLPRINEIFDARKPKNSAIVSELEGTVKIGVSSKGLTLVTVESDTGLKKEYSIPHGKHLIVYENDRVFVGEPITDGSINPHDVLNVLGVKGVQEYLVKELQGVYRLQGVTINDKHFEIIVRQMLLNLRVEKSGDTEFLVGELVNKFDFDSVNEKIVKKKGTAAEAQTVLLGITRAALSSKSFISAASFQETTRVLADSAVKGAVDNLLGLKENVIIGHLIPTGTGLKK
ncbi:MAG: DNA-directed RNA polymerase subunit beta' [Elusimicrobia bacterium ADurb.Bin231]|nr:MAG: DNA-directed RNA polymerase subunit beta' [Elusimicrobia bacterium ADurb.Bin231]